MQSNLMTNGCFHKDLLPGKLYQDLFCGFHPPIRGCRDKRTTGNKVFAGLAQTGKSTMGWFHGFKLHIAIDDKGEILSFCIAQANVDDREPLKNESFFKAVLGKLYADKGYISQNFQELLFVDGIQLIASIRHNMKSSLMNISDKILLRKRSVIETANDELKNICQVEHSRHCSFTNFITNLLAGLMAYRFLPKKPTIKYEKQETNQLALFY